MAYAFARGYPVRGRAFEPSGCGPLLRIRLARAEAAAVFARDRSSRREARGLDMGKVSDDIRLRDLVRRAARALARAGLEHRIDIYRDIEVEDPAVQKMLGRPHRVRVRIRITAQSLLFEERSEHAANDTGGVLLSKQEA